ncbi:kinase-like domain-containing protein [Tirmania nivea]|nr:kinase-like domain-containing protein [Tirmania nivea]
MELSTPADLQAMLSLTPYACTSLVPLTGGLFNATLRGTLAVPLTDGSTTVIVKHAESFPALAEGISWDAIRMDYENEMMHAARKALRIELPNSVTIGIPEVYYYDRKNKILVMQDAGAEVKDLKASLLAGEINSKQADVIGCAIARFASKFHSWSKAQPQLCEDIQKHRQTKTVSLWATYGRLAETIGIVSGNALEEYREAFEQAQLVMTMEMQDSTNHGIIHGDYWTGNILISLDATNKDLGLGSLYVIDWEVSKVAPPLFDIGQMSAEIYFVSHFRRKSEAINLLDSFLCCYHGLDSLSSRCKMAIHFGAHLVVWPIRVLGWGTPKEVEACAKLGAEFIRKGLQVDVEWLKQSVLGQLFKR